MFLKAYKLWGFNYQPPSTINILSLPFVLPQGESYEAVGADFLDAKDGLTLIALEEGGVPRNPLGRYHVMLFGVKVAGV